MSTFLDDDDSDDHTVDTQDTSHDNGHHGFHDEVGFQDTHGADTNTCLSATVGGSEVSEDQGGGDANEAEEIVVGVSSFGHDLMFKLEL